MKILNYNDWFGTIMKGCESKVIKLGIESCFQKVVKCLIQTALLDIFNRFLCYIA